MEDIFMGDFCKGTQGGWEKYVTPLLGGQYGTPHGLANAVILPYVLEAYGSSVHKKLHHLGIAAGVCSENDSPESGAKKFIDAVKGSCGA